MVEFSKLARKVKRQELQDGRPVFGGPADERLSPELKAHVVRPQKIESEQPEPPVEESTQEPVVKNIKPLFTQKRAQEIPSGFTERRAADQVGPGAASKKEEARASVVRPQAGDTSVIYEKMFELGKALFSSGIDYTKVDTTPIVTSVAEVAGVIAAGDEKLAELALTYIMKDEQFYLHQHSVNTCIISLQIGVGAGFEMGRLIELGIAAYLHDIGMSRFEDMANLSRKLTEKEYEQIKGHVSAGDDILKKIDHGLSDTIIATQNEIHERLDGSGYPSGKKVIHDYARIIAVADAFESMLHPRPFRPRYSIMDVYKRIFEHKNKYDQAFIKILVDRVGFFPNGSFVQLNTREVGKVVGQNPRSPLRPVVKISYTEDGHKLYEEDMKEINLIKYPTIHVKKCFLEESDK